MDNSKRTRCWSTILYPESAKDNWKDILSDDCIPCFVSPLHCNDINFTGEIKKSHYHIIFIFDGVKSYSQIKEICSLIGSVEPKVVNSTRGYCRYLCHLDNPDKAQYSIDDVISFGGLIYSDFIDSVNDKYVAIRDMMKFCKDSHIISYSDLLEYACVHELSWFKVLCDNGTIVMKEYLKSLNWKINFERTRI